MKIRFDTFRVKLISVCVIALALFIYGTVKYMGKPYHKDLYNHLVNEGRHYMDNTAKAVDSAQHYECIDDDINKEYFLNKSILYYHIADSFQRQAEYFYVK